MKTPDWYLIDGQWSQSIDDLPLKQCEGYGCTNEIEDSQAYCAKCERELDHECAEIAQAAMVSHFLNRVMR